MGMDLFFNREEAEDKGVTFEELKSDVHQCTPWCSSHLIGTHFPECDCAGETVERVIGYGVTCPDGSVGYAMGYEFFQCKNINPEIKAWFMEHLESADLDF